MSRPETRTNDAVCAALRAAGFPVPYGNAIVVLPRLDRSYCVKLTNAQTSDGCGLVTWRENEHVRPHDVSGTILAFATECGSPPLVLLDVSGGKPRLVSVNERLQRVQVNGVFIEVEYEGEAASVA